LPESLARLKEAFGRAVARLAPSESSPTVSVPNKALSQLTGAATSMIVHCRSPFQKGSSQLTVDGDPPASGASKTSESVAAGAIARLPAVVRSMPKDKG
jgi:hypothetical protein